MCYTIPVAAAIITAATKKKTKILHLDWLNLLLWGGAIMLVVDHLVNGELFLIGKNIWKDLLLGVMMTAAVFAVWGVLVIIHQRKITRPKGCGYKIPKWQE